MKIKKIEEMKKDTGLKVKTQLKAGGAEDVAVCG